MSFSLFCKRSALRAARVFAASDKARQGTGTQSISGNNLQSHSSRGASAATPRALRPASTTSLHHIPDVKQCWKRRQTASLPHLSRQPRGRQVPSRLTRRQARRKCTAPRGLLQQRGRISSSKRAPRGRGCIQGPRPAAQHERGVLEAACRPAQANGAMLYRHRRLHALPWQRARRQAAQLLSQAADPAHVRRAASCCARHKPSGARRQHAPRGLKRGRLPASCGAPAAV